MNAPTRPTDENLLATHIRATMTPDESRYARDERYNVYLALGLDDADVLFVIGSRAIDNGAEDIEAFSEGYLRAITGAPLGEPSESDSLIKGYEEGRRSLYPAPNADESPDSPSAAQSAASST